MNELYYIINFLCIINNMEGLLKPLEEATNIIGEEIGEGIS